jgi:hypothetical protein
MDEDGDVHAFKPQRLDLALGQNVGADPQAGWWCSVLSDAGDTSAGKGEKGHF